MHYDLPQSEVIARISKSLETDGYMRSEWLDRLLQAAKFVPFVPVIPDLDRVIWDTIGSDGNHLQMLHHFHTCATTHCRAGWAIHLCGKCGYLLEERVGSELAGALIYLCSAGYVPSFYASNEEAMLDLEAKALRK